MPGAKTRTTGQSTAPRRWWARTEESDVKQIVASDVATAIFKTCSCGKLCDVRMKVTKGTISMPPPMPSSPAKKPVQRPSAASWPINSGSRDTCFSVHKARTRGGCHAISEDE